MPESAKAAALSVWSAPECPFTLEYSPRALDDIRLAVVDAFFSLPRGGAEIGGVLFGKWDGKSLAVADFAALDCEHAFGPSFTLSPRDEARLTALLVAPAANGFRPVGWYHSHTRSEIFLSDADREIHRRFFPEPWQVALVLKPHTFHPTRAGFFFRGADGGIHAEKSYLEFVLTPIVVKPAPPAVSEIVESKTEPASAAAPAPAPIKQELPAPEPAPVVKEEPAEPQAVPKFLVAPPPPSRRWLYAVTFLLVGFGLGAVAYLRRDEWIPQLTTLVSQHMPATAPVSLSLGLNAVDHEGQLQIRWNRDSPAVQQATAGVLSIEALGVPHQEISLDKAHLLLSDGVTLGRQTERVDVSLSLTEPNGGAARDMTTFIGKLPEPKRPEETSAPQSIDQLSKQVAKMQSEFNARIEQDTKAKKALDDLSRQVRDLQRSRPVNQVPGKK